ncbi:hypothetical protein HD806DRAFT_409936 [Xylariaceae sp. AK1471]|nr:hypothetical protein HD806DRAFT_409936 [Xylariaceae sp. AK1471]
MLYEVSTTMETWQQGKYGRCLSFCDCATLADVRKMWAFYSVEQKGAESTRFRGRFQSALDKAKAKRQNPANPNQSRINAAGFRSASPAHIGCLEDLNTLNQHYWKYGTTELKADIRSGATHPNSAFLTLGDGAVIHYGTDPLLGFHLAAVDAPLDSIDAVVNRLPRREKYAALARAEFREWVVSYRERSQRNNVRVRFLIGDAVSFAHTLQHKCVTSENTAHWYRDQYGVHPLMLDGPDYAPGARAPVQFDVIDTSNLCDHLGSLTLLTATSPLLRNDVSAVLYTEVLAKNHKGYREVLDQMLCGHVPTLSTLLGLFPVEYWRMAQSDLFAHQCSINEVKSTMFNIKAGSELLRRQFDAAAKGLKSDCERLNTSIEGISATVNTQLMQLKKELQELVTTNLSKITQETVRAEVEGLRTALTKEPLPGETGYLTQHCLAPVGEDQSYES